MAYTSKSNMSRVRRLAVNDVKYRGFSYQKAAFKYGVTKSAVWKWMQRADLDHRVFIETKSSRPHHQSHELSPDVVKRILELREEYQRCAPVIHAYLVQEGVIVSLASVGRVLQRYGATKNKRKVRWGTNPHRPVSDAPGVLVQMDTMHVVRADYSRFYVYAVIDTFSRIGYAEYQPRIPQIVSTEVLFKARKYFNFPFHTVQTGNGPEFKHGFEFSLALADIQVRHSRIRRPNDNAHVERFIRTIQDECFRGKMPKETTAADQLKEYIEFYNNQRLHLCLNLQTPRSIVSKLLS
jgi:transposase InsO family protein